MKTRRNLYIIIGSFLVLVNLLSDLAALGQGDNLSNEMSFNIGYVIGAHFMLIFGILFLWLAYRLHKKIKAKNLASLETTIESIGG